LTVTFIGSPDTIVAQIKRCREEVGVGVVDLIFHNPGDDPAALMDTLELFGTKVLPRIREV
jgi:alkanesulfonate monooxygenase SsuD/methylene tetrahydromethanopterin reductase-like flavin-dependent oxidoreductase (luciferase family)